MNLSRLRLLSGLTESVSTDPRINERIERALEGFPAQQQTELLDALHIIQDANTEGVTIPDWGMQIAQMHGARIDLNNIMRTILSDFSFCVKRAGEGRIAWKDHDIEPLLPEPPPVDATPDHGGHMGFLKSFERGLADPPKPHRLPRPPAGHIV
jgi:hypothetical protein